MGWCLLKSGSCKIQWLIMLISLSYLSQLFSMIFTDSEDEWMRLRPVSSHTSKRRAPRAPEAQIRKFKDIQADVSDI